MENQCNTCGGFEKLDVCTHCTTVVCESCKRNHAPLCEELKKRKARGEGPTIANMPQDGHRHGHEVPLAGGPDRHNTMPAVLGAPYDLSKLNPQPADPYKLFIAPSGLVAYAEKMAAPTEPIDQAIAAVADLLKVAEDETGK